MITEPKIVERGYRRYVALRDTTSAAGIPALVDAGFPRLLAHLAARGVERAGAPFIRYRAMSDATMDIDLGVPYASDVGDDGWGDGAVSAERLPAGRYAHLVHTGASLYRRRRPTGSPPAPVPRTDRPIALGRR